jgi:DNA repair exonuclease SbcCD ATPase subunit
VPLRIINLFAENIKRLKAVDISPKGDTVIISGKNEAGKSSVLDSFWLALEWAKANKLSPRPIRDGEDHAMVVVDMGDYRVTRQFRLNGDEEVTTRLTVERANGDTVKSPQTLIDSFIGSLSFDPLEFMRKTPKEQREMLAEVSKLNLVELDAQHKTLYDERADLNREVKVLNAHMSNIAPPSDSESADEIKVDDLLAESAKLRTEKDATSDHIGVVAGLEEKVERLEKQLVEALNDLGAAKLRAKSYRPVVDITDDMRKADDKIRSLGDLNKRAKDIKFYNDTTEKVNKIQNRLTEIESGINEIKTARETAIAEAELPIDGLVIGDDGVTFKGQPLSQLSTSQQIKISMVLAMAANPELRVIRIKDGSLLDKENLVLIDEIAKGGDFQVWIECVDDSGKMGFYIEDGTVAAVNECIT